MSGRHTKLLSSQEAVEDIIHDLESSIGQRKLFGQVYTQLIGGAFEVGRGKYIEGIWYFPEKNSAGQFINCREFGRKLVKAFFKCKPDERKVAKLYSEVFDVEIEIAEDGNNIRIFTEMEKFECKQCGICCLTLRDVYNVECDPIDLQRWRDEARDDILKYVYILEFDEGDLGDLWFSPVTRDQVTRCPWLRKMPNKNVYKCRIHETKPQHCRAFPQTKKKAIYTGCRGFE